MSQMLLDDFVEAVRRHPDLIDTMFFRDAVAPHMRRVVEHARVRDAAKPLSPPEEVIDVLAAKGLIRRGPRNSPCGTTRYVVG